MVDIDVNKPENDDASIVDPMELETGVASRLGLARTISNLAYRAKAGT
jgi:hypothetical protein